MRPKPLTGDLLTIYDALHASFGHQHWWPAKTPFETMVGAILTQNVSWTNAAQAIANLEAAGMLDPDLLAAADTSDIAQLIVPSGSITRRRSGSRSSPGSTFTEFQADPAGDGCRRDRRTP